MHPRHQAILQLLGEAPTIDGRALAARFGVTPATIRRDLDELSRLGLVTRTHGGAVLAERGQVAFTFRQRREQMAAAKRAIAREAAARVQPGMAIALDTGTTTLELARRLSEVDGLRVLTASLPIAAALHSAPGIELILLGGQTRKDHPDLVGELAEDNLRRFHVDLAFLGTDGADRDGLMTADPAIARLSGAMLRHATAAILVADHTKFDRQAFVRFARWDQLAGVITDDGLPGAPRQWLASVWSGSLTCAPLSRPAGRADRSTCA